MWAILREVQGLGNVARSPIVPSRGTRAGAQGGSGAVSSVFIVATAPSDAASRAGCVSSSCQSPREPASSCGNRPLPRKRAPVLYAGGRTGPGACVSTAKGLATQRRRQRIADSKEARASVVGSDRWNTVSPNIGPSERASTERGEEVGSVEWDLEEEVGPGG